MDEYAVQARNSESDPWEIICPPYEDVWVSEEEARSRSRECKAIMQRINGGINLDNWRIVVRRAAGPMEVYDG